MSVKRISSILPALLLLIVAQTAVAAVPQTIAFQGFLADEDGAPLDGTVNLQLSIYDVASGGTARWTETQGPVAVSDGVLSVALGAVTPLPGGLFETGPRFLGVAVNGEEELPRTELRATPFAMRAEAADTTTTAIMIADGSSTRLTTFVEPNGIALRGHADGAVAWSLEARDSGVRSRLDLYTSDGGAARMGDFQFVDGPMLQLGSFDGTTEVFAGAMSLFSPNGQSVLISPDLAAGESVRLPNNAIDDVEIGDEPGLASRINSGFTALTGTLSSVLSRTITPPADGYVLALGQCVARINHTSGTATGGAAGLSEDAVEFASAQDVNILIASGAASGAYSMPLHVNAVFGVTAEVSKTIHFAGREDSGVIELEDVSLTLLFVPTAYGTVSESLAAADDGEGGGARGPQTAAEIDAERSESRRANDDRLASELAAMAARQAELAAHQAAMEEELAAMRAELEAAGSRR